MAVETRLAKRQRLETRAQEALEENIAYWVARGVPPGVVRNVLQVARVLRRALPLPSDIIDRFTLQYLWDIRRPVREMWGWMRPISKFHTFRDNNLDPENVRGIFALVKAWDLSLRVRNPNGIISHVSRAVFKVDVLQRGMGHFAHGCPLSTMITLVKTPIPSGLPRTPSSPLMGRAGSSGMDTDSDPPEFLTNGVRW